MEEENDAINYPEITTKELKTLNEEGPTFFWGGRSSNSLENYRPRRRRVIAHGYCIHDDMSWKPHFAAMEPQYTENGPDWKSMLRYIPEPKDETKKNEDLWPEKSTHIRTYPGSSQPTFFEWTYYTNGYSVGKKCFFNNMHLRSNYSADEITDKSRFGIRRKLYSIDTRNGIPCASLGDKTYQAVEYSSDFHKVGSTLPLPNFGHAFVKKTDTFIPLTPLPAIPCEPYTIKEKKRQKNAEIKEVHLLEEWKPAIPLSQTLVEPAPTNLKSK